MTNEDDRIKEAFWSVLAGDFSEEDKSILLEHRNDAYTYESRTGIDNPLTQGENALSIFTDYFERSDRPFEYEEDAGRVFEGTLGEILSYVAEMSDTKLPVELQDADSYNLRVFDVRDFYDQQPKTVKRSEDDKVLRGFYNAINGKLTQEDKNILLKHQDEIYTFEWINNAGDPLSKGRNALSHFSSLTRLERQHEYKDGAACAFEGKLGELLAFVAEEEGAELPKELQYENVGYNLRAFYIRDVCNKFGDLLPINNLELFDAPDSSLDIDDEAAFIIEQKSVGIRATIEANKEKAATKEPVKPSKDHMIGEDR